MLSNIKIKLSKRSKLIFILFLLLISSTSIFAKTSYNATTIENPYIALDELEIMLIPLDEEELFVEADGWKKHLKTVSTEIAKANLKIKKENNKINNKEVFADAQEKIQEGKDELKKIDGKKARKEFVKEFKKEIKDDLSDDLKGNIKKDLKDINKANDLSQQIEPSVNEIEEKKEDILSLLDDLRGDQRHIVDALNLVLDSINEKIGLQDNGKERAEMMPFRMYIDAVSGLKLDVTDTKSTWLSIQGYIFSEDGGLKWIKNILIFSLVLFLFWFLAKALCNTVKKAISLSDSKSKILNEFIIKSVKRLVLFIGLLAALSAVDISVAPIMAVIGATGFVVAFALQSTLSNFASGIMIMLYRPFDVEDVIEVAGVMGTVKSLTLVSTTIMTMDNKLMIVPNNSIWGDVIINAHHSSTRRVDMVFGIGYEDDIDKAMDVMKQVLKEHPLVLEFPESDVAVFELADSSVNFICRPWVKTFDYWTVYWDITRLVKIKFDEASISIPYPQSDIHIHHLNNESKNS